MPEATPDERQRLLRTGHIEPLTPVIAGTPTTVTFRIEFGERPVPQGGHSRIAWLWPFDWAKLQTDDTMSPNFLTASCSKGNVSLRPTYIFRGDLMPWNHQIDIEVVSGELKTGDQLEIVCRDWRAPTFIVPQAEFLMLINPDGGDRWLELVPTPSFPIVAGRAARLVALAPADGLINEDLELTLRVEDAWGNPCIVETAPQVTASDGATVTAAEPAGNLPAYRCSVSFANTGTHRLTATVPSTDLWATTNPTRITAERPVRRIFWGDLHSGQGHIGCGIGSVSHHFDYARHVAGLQFSSHQANDHHVTRDLWKQTRHECAAAHEDGRFVTYRGCEWSAYTPDGGDRNVFYRYDEPRLRRSGRFFTEDTPDPEPDLKTATSFLEAMRDEPVYVNMHAGGRPTNLDFHEPRIETLAEIHSTHGTSDWFVLDALRRGYRVGITAGTDGVAGRPGADHPGSRMIRNVRSGITAFLANELTEAALWEAIGARRCYATDGQRMLLEVTVDGHLMGEEFETDGEPLIEISVEGTTALEQIDLLCGTEVLWTRRLAPPSADGTIRVLWGGTEQCGTASDQRARWDGQLTFYEGRILSCEPVAFVTPYDHLKQTDDRTVEFQTITAGNRMGMQIHLEGDASTTGRFVSGPTTFEFNLHQVRTAAITVEAGGASRHVIAGPLPDDSAPRHARISWRDTRTVADMCPYWVRVTQVDQHRAWSSPVYVTRQ